MSLFLIWPFEALKTWTFHAELSQFRTSVLYLIYCHCFCFREWLSPRQSGRCTRHLKLRKMKLHSSVPGCSKLLPRRRNCRSRKKKLRNQVSVTAKKGHKLHLTLKMIALFVFPSKLLRSWSGLWVLRRRRRRPENSCRFSWRSKWERWKEPAKRRGRICSRNSHGSNRRLSLLWRSGTDLYWKILFITVFFIYKNALQRLYVMK